MEICIIQSEHVEIERQPFEVVERKGIGHPDTLADGIAEIISCDYSEFCRKNFGAVLHQTLDKIMISGGRAELGYGHAVMLEPWRLFVNGRISSSFGTTAIDYEELIRKSVKAYLANTVPSLDADRWLKITFSSSTFSRNPHWFKPRGLHDLPDATAPFANDTSVAIGYWPLSVTERLTLFLEGCFYDDKGAPRYPYLGQDIKVMSIRQRNNIDAVLCVPFMCAQIHDPEAYHNLKSEITRRLTDLGNDYLGGVYKLSVTVNPVDALIDAGGGIGQYFFVASGSSLDSGEEGVVGRGNRSRGFIGSVRPNSLEGIHGKNPVYYAGKVYNYVADVLAMEIAEKFGCSCVVYIMSRSGDGLSEPSKVIIEASDCVSRQVVEVAAMKLLASDLTSRILAERPFVPVPGGGHGFRALVSTV